MWVETAQEEWFVFMVFCFSIFHEHGETGIQTEEKKLTRVEK